MGNDRVCSTAAAMTVQALQRNLKVPVRASIQTRKQDSDVARSIQASQSSMKQLNTDMSAYFCVDGLKRNTLMRESSGTVKPPTLKQVPVQQTTSSTSVGARRVIPITPSTQFQASINFHSNSIVRQSLAPAALAPVKMLTISGYIENLQALASRVLGRQVQIPDKKDQEKVFVQVPKRKPHIKNFSDNDPRLEKIQGAIMEKIKRTGILHQTTTGTFGAPTLLQGALRKLEGVHMKYKQVDKGPENLPLKSRGPKKKESKPPKGRRASRKDSIKCQGVYVVTPTQ